MRVFSDSLRRVLPVLAVMGLGGCAVYNVAGTFEDTGEAFYGTVTVAIDQGSVNVVSADGKVSCDGTSMVTKRPSYNTNVGGQGRAEAKCTDGRTFKVDFIQTSTSGGHGKGIDSNGGIVNLYFDMSAEALRAKMAVDKLDRLVK